MRAQSVVRALVVSIASLATLLAVSPPAAAAQVEVHDVDPTTLDETPVIGGGVRGFVQPSVPQNWRVHAFAEIGDRLYVGGSFTHVRERPWGVSPQHRQSFLAAFDLVTNNYVPEFAPQLDDAVWSLAVHDGRLLVGGEFDRVNGQNRQGLVALDPETGATDATFRATIANDGNGFEPSARALEVIGDQLYVVGDFNRLVEGGDRHGRLRAARVDATTGNLDSSWAPFPFGGAIYDVAVDTGTGKVFLGGNFSSVNGSAGTKNFAAVSIQSGATVGGHTIDPLQPSPNLTRQYSLDTATDKVWIGGEQHHVRVHNRSNFARRGCLASGAADQPDRNCNYRRFILNGDGGGDYQIVETIDDSFIVTGCHCRSLVYSSFSNRSIDLNGAGARLYWPNGSDIDFLPETPYWNEGPYAAFGDSRGCLYIGGDLTGNVDGFARFCSPARPFGTPDATAQVDGNDVTISWSASADTKGYLVHIDHDFEQFSTTPGFTTTLPDGTYRFDIRAQRPNNSLSAPRTLVVEVGDAALLVPPENPSISTDGSTVELRWDAGAAAQGYLVHRDFTFLAYTRATSYVDDEVEPGRSYRYQIRAQNAAKENSAPTDTLRITVGDVDQQAPSTPANVSVTLQNGNREALVTWSRSNDNVGVRGYLVHHNWQFEAFVTEPRYVDDDLAPGTIHRYQVRAQDAARNNSAPSPIERVTTP